MTFVQQIRAVCLFFFMVASSVVVASIDVYEFQSDEARERFHNLTEELRCPKCQNQNLADSNSGISQDLRQQVYQMIDEGKSDEQVVDFMVARYGEFVRYKPKVSPETYLLWYGPYALLAFGFLTILLIVRHQRSLARQRSAEAPSNDASQVEHKGLSDEEANALDALLDKKDSAK